MIVRQVTWYNEIMEKSRNEVTPEFLMIGAFKEHIIIQNKIIEIKNQFETALHENKLNIENKLFIEKSLNLLQDSLVYVKGNQDFNSYYNGMLSSITTINESICKLTQVINLTCTVKQIDNNSLKLVKNVVENVDSGLATKIERMCKTIVFNSNSNTPSKKIYYLKGNSGVGKTYLVKKIINLFNLPFLETKMYLDRFDSEIDVFLTRNKYKNSIIFVDEAGDSIDAWSTKLKFLFDPDNNKLESKLLKSTQYTVFDWDKVYHDISNVTFILTGNYDITDKALQSRLDTIIFPKINLQNRKIIANMLVNDMTQNKESVDTRIINKIINETHKNFDGCRELKHLIQNYIVELNNDPNIVFNVQKEIASFVHSVKNIKNPKKELDDTSIQKI